MFCSERVTTLSFTEICSTKQAMIIYVFNHRLTVRLCVWCNYFGIKVDYKTTVFSNEEDIKKKSLNLKSRWTMKDEMFEGRTRDSNSGGVKLDPFTNKCQSEPPPLQPPLSPRSLPAWCILHNIVLRHKGIHRCRFS